MLRKNSTKRNTYEYNHAGYGRTSDPTQPHSRHFHRSPSLPPERGEETTGPNGVNISDNLRYPKKDFFKSISLAKMDKMLADFDHPAAGHQVAGQRAHTLMEENHHTNPVSRGFCSSLIGCLPCLMEINWRRLLPPTSSAGHDRYNTTGWNLQNATRLTKRELQEITDNFSIEREIGEGANGKVYKGMLNGKEVAVKVLHKTLRADDKQFRCEFENLVRLEHRNIVRLVGYCYDTQLVPMLYKGKNIYAEDTTKALCLEYMRNGSLANHLKEEDDGLDWNTRYKIIKGMCEGLQYLHEGFKESIYHLDLKPENILLDENMAPKLADFGLSRLFIEQKTVITKSFAGTLGYIPKEYIHGQVISNKFDVFSLGVVMTKIIAGPNGPTRRDEVFDQDFLDHVQENWRNRLQKTWSSHVPLEAHCEQVNICTKIALSCMEDDRKKRPTIADIMHQLNETEASIMMALSLLERSRLRMQGDLVKLNVFTRSEAILSAETRTKFPILVRVTSPGWHRAEEMGHAGLDVVAVVLNCNWLWLRCIQLAMKMVVDKLGPNDRLSIMSFKGNVPCIMKLTFMSDQGRVDANRKVNELEENHDNIMFTGLGEGIEILRRREVKEGDNRVGCIMLMSDSNDEAILAQKISSDFPVHTFGLGDQHGPEVMKYIADMTSATYSFINRMNYSDDLKDACELFIASIKKVTATSVKITLGAHEGVKISYIESGSYNNEVSYDEKTGEIYIDNIYAGEQKNFIVYLIVEKGKKKLLTVGGSYRSLIDVSKQLADMEVSVQRPHSKCSKDKLTINREVAGELVRIKLVKGISDMMGLDRRIHCELDQLWESLRSSEEANGAPEKTLTDLSKDVAEMMKSSTYEFFKPEKVPKKVPYITSWLSCHMWQRATTKGSFYDSGAFTVAQHADGEDDADA